MTGETMSRFGKRALPMGWTTQRVRRWWAIAGFSVCLLGVGTSCVAETGLITAPAFEYGYAPIYYDGYIVYFDTAGRPYYYVNGAVVWIPPTVRIYPALVRHWRAHRPAYGQWYRHRGHEYRSYRFHGRRHR